MFAAVLLLAPAAESPRYTVVNHCPPAPRSASAYTVTSHLPVRAASCPCGPNCGCSTLGYAACGSAECPALANYPLAAPAYFSYPPAAVGSACAGGQCGPAYQYPAPARGLIRRW